MVLDWTGASHCCELGSPVCERRGVWSHKCGFGVWPLARGKGSAERVVVISAREHFGSGLRCSGDWENATNTVAVATPLPRGRAIAVGSSREVRRNGAPSAGQNCSHSSSRQRLCVQVPGLSSSLRHFCQHCLIYMPIAPISRCTQWLTLRIIAWIEPTLHPLRLGRHQAYSP